MKKKRYKFGLFPGFLKYGQTGQFFGNERAKQEAHHKRDNEKVVEVFAEHIECFRWEHAREKYIQPVSKYKTGRFESTWRCRNTSHVVNVIVVV